MDFTLFNEIIERNKERDDKLEAIYNLGLDLTLLDDSYDFMVRQMLDAHWTTEGVDWIYWFMYDSEYGTKDWSDIDIILKVNDNGTYEEVESTFDDGYGAHDDEGKPICYDNKSLYDYIKQYEKPIYEVIKNPIPKTKKK